MFKIFISIWNRFQKTARVYFYGLNSLRPKYHRFVSFGIATINAVHSDDVLLFSNSILTCRRCRPDDCIRQEMYSTVGSKWQEKIKKIQITLFPLAFITFTLYIYTSDALTSYVPRTLLYLSVSVFQISQFFCKGIFIHEIINNFFKNLLSFIVGREYWIYL